MYNLASHAQFPQLVDSVHGVDEILAVSTCWAKGTKDFYM